MSWGGLSCSVICWMDPGQVGTSQVKGRLERILRIVETGEISVYLHSFCLENSFFDWAQK